MTIECYYIECPNHSVNADPDEGPFCYEDNCVRSAEERVVFQANRNAMLKRYGFPPDPEVKHDS